MNRKYAIDDGPTRALIQECPRLHGRSGCTLGLCFGCRPRLIRCGDLANAPGQHDEVPGMHAGSIRFIGIQM